MGPRWVQEGFESEFFVQLGVLMGVLAPRWQDEALQDESEGVVHGGTWVVHGELGTTWVSRRRRRGPLESYRVRLGVRYSCLITAYSIQ